MYTSGTDSTRMLGVASRICDHKGCTCNPSPGNARRLYKKAQRRRENQAFRAQARTWTGKAHWQVEAV